LGYSVSASALDAVEGIDRKNESLEAFKTRILRYQRLHQVDHIFGEYQLMIDFGPNLGSMLCPMMHTHEVCQLNDAKRQFITQIYKETEKNEERRVSQNTPDSSSRRDMQKPATSLFGDEGSTKASQAQDASANN
jgi:hypothetical protein